MVNLTYPLVIGGVSAGAFGLIAGLGEKDWRSGLVAGTMAATVVAIATAAYIAFSTLSESIGKWAAAAIVGAGCGLLAGVVAIIDNDNLKFSDVIFATFAGSFLAVIGLRIWITLNSRVLDGWLFVNGEFVPIYRFKKP